MAEKITREELDTIREWLPEGANKRIADETGLAVRSIDQILLQPKRFNKKVIKVALRIMEEEKAEIAAMKNRINQPA